MPIERNIESGFWTGGKILTLVGAGILCLLLIILSGSLVERNDAGQVLVIQNVSGTLSVYTEPGYYGQWFGKVTKYKKSFQYWFSSKDDQGGNKDQSIKIRFNDGGHANISGSIRVDLPTKVDDVLKFHSTFGSQEALEQQLIRTTMERSVYLTGPLVSSKESYAEKRNDLVTYIEDQARLGVYQTTSKSTEVEDVLSKAKKTVNVVEIKKDSLGLPLRQEESALKRFGVTIYNLSLNEITYDDTVEKQIKSQQELMMQVQTAIATSRKAEQEALTAAKQGEAKVAIAKADQDAKNATMISEAEGRKTQAELDAKAAEFTKAKLISEGQGEATKRKLLNDANGSLDPKLNALIQINQAWAQAYANIKVPIVPSVYMAGGSGKVPSTTDFMDLIVGKTAKDLAVDTKLDDKK